MGKKLNSSDNWKKTFHRESRNRKIILIVIMCVILFMIFFGAYVFQGLPSLEQLENPKSILASKVYSLDGELLGQFFIENRIETQLDNIPDNLKNALIATEDRQFYSHWGVNLARLFKAMVVNVFTLSGKGGGASTITQQLAKNLYNLKVKNESTFDTFIRKIREWITAIQIEKTYTKKEILEMYLNISYFGRSAFGVETASHIFFHKKAHDLTLPESAVLIALLKSSVNYDPVTKYENALQRRNLVMRNMVDAGYLSEENYNKYKNMPIELGGEHVGGYATIAPHFMEYVRRQMENMSDKYGYDLYRDGLNIYTTLDARMQRIANTVASDHLKDYQKIFDKAWNWNRRQDILKVILDKAIN
jgi:penicillin-binding protein 1A